MAPINWQEKIDELNEMASHFGLDAGAGMLGIEPIPTMAEAKHVDPVRDKAVIEAYLLRITSYGGMADSYQLDPPGRPQSEGLYSVQDSGDSPEHYEEAVKTLVEERLNEYSQRIRNNIPSVGRALTDSVVRLDTQAAIESELAKGASVLIRGPWRVGKSTMGMCVGTHYGRERCIYEDIGIYTPAIDHIRKHLCRRDVATLLTLYRQPGLDPKSDQFDELRDKIDAEIDASGKSPLIFLNEQLMEMNFHGSVLVVLDEVIGWIDKQTEALEFITELAALEKIQFLVVMHSFAKYEQQVADIFQDWPQFPILPISVEEATAMFSSWFAGTAVRFEPDAITELHKMSGGRPLEMACFANALLTSHDRCFAGKDIISKRDIVQNLGDHNQYYIWDRVIDTPFRTYRRIFDRTLSAQQQEIVGKLVAEDSLSRSEIDPKDAQFMRDVGVIIQDGDRYQLNGSYLKLAMSWKLEEER